MIQLTQPRPRCRAFERPPTGGRKFYIGQLGTWMLFAELDGNPWLFEWSPLDERWRPYRRAGEADVVTLRELGVLPRRRAAG